MKEPAPLQSAEEDPWAGSRLGKIGTKMKNTDHVMADEGGLTCTHCSEVRRHPQTPERAIDYADRLLGFVRIHRPCQKAPVPDRQLPLPVNSGARCGMCGMVTPPGALRPLHHVGCGVGAPIAPKPAGAIDASTDDPAPAIDPPSHYAKFHELYPLPRTREAMLDAVSFGLTGEQFKAFREKCDWDPSTGMFDAAATWGRIEQAHVEAAYRARDGAPAIVGLTLPARTPMPEKVAELISLPEKGVEPKAKKGGAKKKRSRPA